LILFGDNKRSSKKNKLVEIFIDHDKLLDTNVCTNAKEKNMMPYLVFLVLNVRFNSDILLPAFKKLIQNTFEHGRRKAFFPVRDNTERFQE